jgi:hypothetical protein
MYQQNYLVGLLWFVKVRGRRVKSLELHSLANDPVAIFLYLRNGHFGFEANFQINFHRKYLLVHLLVY